MESFGRFTCVTLDGSTFHWEQDAHQLTIYIPISLDIKSKDIHVNFKAHSLLVKIKNKEVLRGNLFKTVLVDDCCWIISDNCLEITLIKSVSHQTWEYFLDTCNKLSKNEVETQKAKMLLERFQQDHPSFDFSGAAVEGSIPDATTFMKP